MEAQREEEGVLALVADVESRQVGTQSVDGVVDLTVKALVH